MTFRPSDDVLEEQALDQLSQGSDGVSYTTNESPEMVQNSFDNDGGINQNIVGEQNSQIQTLLQGTALEEVQAPDLSVLLGGENSCDVIESKENNVSSESIEITEDGKISGNIVTDNIVNNEEQTGLQSGTSITDEQQGLMSDVSQSNDVIKPVEEIQTESVQYGSSQGLDLSQIKDTEDQQLESVVKKNTINMLDQTQSIMDSEQQNTEIDGNLQGQQNNQGLNGGISDDERVNMVSKMELAVHSNLDLFVDEKLYHLIKVYKIFHRIMFKWGFFILVTICGILSGFFLQTKADHTIAEIVVDGVKFETDNGMSALINSINQSSDHLMNILIPYGTGRIANTILKSKSNLILYDGIVLPQSTSINFSKDLFSLENFEAKKTTRADLESLYETLMNMNVPFDVTHPTTNPYSIDGGLIEGFGLSCLDTDKFSDIVCDDMVQNFYDNGKYYNLDKYGDELLSLTKILRSKGKDVEPVCKMVNEFIGYAGTFSQSLKDVVSYCDDYLPYYNELTAFIDADKGLKVTPTIDVYSYSAINEYKLLSIQQVVYRQLEGGSYNISYMESYLDFVSELLSKDKGSNKYLDPLYKDLTYLFNEKLNNKLERASTSLLSTQDKKTLQTKISNINNGGGAFLAYVGLKSQLTTPDLITTCTGSGCAGSSVVARTFDELLESYYNMKNLLIDDTYQISDEEVRIKVKISSTSISDNNDGDSLLAILYLYKKNNILYVREIYVPSHISFTKIMNSIISEKDVSLDKLLAYIDENAQYINDRVKEEYNMCETFEDKYGKDELFEIYLCNDSVFQISKGDVEYNFTMNDGILDTYAISDEKLEKEIKDKESGIIFTQFNTENIIGTILDYEGDEPADENKVDKLDIINQFETLLATTPNVFDIEGESELFMVQFNLGEFPLQAQYNINTHQLTKFYYMTDEKLMPIRGLTLVLTQFNTDLVSIVNNPRVFLASADSAAFRRYQERD